MGGDGEGLPALLLLGMNFIYRQFAFRIAVLQGEYRAEVIA